ncbi:MAG: C1 family peptidase [bacterium]|nr:C1 family peptidase [bacterium]
MYRFSVILILICVTCASSVSAAEPPKGLTQFQVKELLNSIEMDAPTRAAMNAVTNNDIKDLALNREIVAQNDDIYSFKLPSESATDQESSGRCWMFAGLNLLRPSVIKKCDLDEFELSQSYLAFWDLLEKSNVFLEYIIETRDRDIQDRELVKQLDEPIGDGGYWGYVVNIIEKYGVVPKKFMGETRSSANTGRMTYVLTTLLRRDAASLRAHAKAGKSDVDLRLQKLQMLKDVMRVLVINYGLPPAQFEWRTADSTGKVSDPITYTPQKFYTDVIGVDLTEYVSLASYPTHPFGQNYSINTSRSMADKSEVTFVNIEADQMKSLVLKALLDSNRIWFGCDVGHEANGKKGLLVKGLYNYEELFGVKLDMTKEERLDYRSETSNHAMVFEGVDIVDRKPRKWLVQNSWGKDVGDDGFFAMSDDWFNEYVLNVIIPKKYLPAEILNVTKQAPTPLPVWDPVWKSLGL